MVQDERLIELLSGSLDDDLSAAESAELEALVEGSAEARELAEELKTDRKALRGLPALSAPAALKQKTLLKTRMKAPGGAPPWTRRLMMAAGLLVTLGLLWTVRPGQALMSRLHLQPGQLAMTPAEASRELHLLAADANKPHVMMSQAVTGRFNGGQARLHLRCDAGSSKGGRLKVALAFDFDGDGKVDLRTDDQVLEVDDREGYQELACVFPHHQGMRDLARGRVHVELSSESADGPGLKVQLDPAQARLELPYDALQGMAAPEGTVEASHRPQLHS
jgi:hypothetical protein